jgi:hypothetical protein
MRSNLTTDQVKTIAEVTGLTIDRLQQLRSSQNDA